MHALLFIRSKYLFKCSTLLSVLIKYITNIGYNILLEEFETKVVKSYLFKEI